MKRLFILIFLCLFSLPLQAESWVKYNIITKYVEGTRQGDGYKMGICGKNNANILTGYILATAQEYGLAKQSYKKVDTNIVGSSRVIDLTQTEIDTILQAEVNAQKQTLLDRIDKYEVSNIDLLTALVKRINVRLPNNPITKQELINEIKSGLGL